MSMTRGGGLYRSRRHHLVAGVAGGLAERFGLPVWLMRLFWLILLIPGGLPGLVPYALLWIIMPLEPEDFSFSRR
jgi:phage shock protein PspC (stress-responsive transcriptional regulator)